MRVRGRRNRRARGAEDDEEGVALGADLAAAGSFDGRADAAAVLVEDAFVPRPRAASSRVEPSMSVKRNVTVPVGRARPA